MKRIPTVAFKALILGVLLAPSSLYAQTGDTATNTNIEIDEKEDFYYLQFHEGEGTPLKDLILLCEKITEYPIQFQELEVADAKINIIGRQKIKKSKQGFFEYFQSILVSYEFICAPYGPEGDPFFITIKKMSPATASRGGDMIKAQAPVIPLEEVEKYKDSPGRLITTSIQLRYIESRQAIQSMNPYFMQNAQLESIRAVDNSNSIIITAFANKVYYIHKLIKLMDVEPQETETEFRKRELAYAVAEELEPILTQLIAAAQTRRPGGTSTPRTTGVLAEPEPKIIAEPMTNSLLITGSEKTVTKILSWIDVLDVEVDPKGDIHVYRLKNTLAVDMQKVLEDMLKGQQQGTTGRRPSGNTGRTGSTTGSYETMAQVVADDASNSLVITATKTKYAELLEVIKKLDVRRRQVLIECAIVELKSRIDDALGVELGGIDLKGENSGSYQRPFGFTNFGLSELLDTDNDGLPDQRSPSVNTGFTGGIFEGDGFAIPFIVSMLSRKTDANILSMPSILTNDNEKAFITAEDEEPTFQFNQGQNTDSTSFKDYVTAGITLEISPSISAGNYLKLELKINVSDFDDASDLSPPPKSSRIIESAVTVPDGHTMVIGGVVANDKTHIENKVPFLGDLPLLGWLFRSTSETEVKTNLYVFITPHIIGDDFANLDDISYVKKKEVESLNGDVLLIDKDYEYSNADSTVIDAAASWIFEIPSYAEPDTGEMKKEFKDKKKNQTEETQYGDL